METIRLENIKKTINDKVILNNINIGLYESEIVGLLGPNGSGKTTLIKIILGLITKYDGKVNINGFDTKKKRELALENVSVVLDEQSLYLDMTGYENLKFFSMIDYPEKIHFNNIINLLDFDLYNKNVKDYSLGMKQQLSIAISMLKKNKILLLDEPLNGLDPESVLNFKNMLKNIKLKNKATIIISSHSLKDLESICDRFLFLKNGKLKKVLKNENNLNIHKYYLLTNNNDKALKILNSNNCILSRSNNSKYILIQCGNYEIGQYLNLLMESGVDVNDVIKDKFVLEKEYFEII